MATTSNTNKRRSVTPGAKSRRLETHSAGPAVLPARSGRRLLLPHERDEAAIPEAPTAVAGHRRLIRRAARDVDRGLVDTEARGTPSNVPTSGRRSGKKRRAGSAG